MVNEGGLVKSQFIASAAVLVLLATSRSATTAAVDLLPSHWPAEARQKAEQVERERWDPATAHVVTGKNGVISATVSPVAVLAGTYALEQGGTAADAAATVALTQVARQLGSVVSYAGIMTMLYYDSKSGRVYSMDAGYDSYRGETDPASIPNADLGSLGAITGLAPPPAGAAVGRETLVPGFMAGIEAMHKRFGKLPFKSLFTPAIAYAKNGVTVSPHLAGFFAMRASVLAKTPEGQLFLHQAGNDLPKAGDNFVQPDLAKTLAGVAEHGASYMYTGAWGRDFVAAVQKAGGKATAADLAAYTVSWNEPYTAHVFGHTVYVNGAPNYTVYQVLTGLNIAEALGLERRGPYWSDPAGLVDLTRIGEFVGGGPVLNPAAIDVLKSKGIDTSTEAQRTQRFGQAVAPLMGELFAAPPSADTHHSNSIVVVDKSGNIAVVTHTINAVIWGGTGIVVGGIPLPDSAGFQQQRLALLKPGDRVPNEIACTLTFEGAKPVLATAPIGSSLIPETIKTILGVIGQKLSPKAVVAAPAVLVNFDATGGSPVPLGQRPLNVPAGAYAADFLDHLKSLGVTVRELPAATARGLRGTLAIVAIDPATGIASSPNVPGVMVFAEAR